MDKPDLYSIPAYQRKRSIMRKALKQNTPITKKPSKKQSSKKKSTNRFSGPEIITEIPISSIMPSQQLFPEVTDILEAEPDRKHSGVREMRECGFCEGYFDTIEVAIIKLTNPLREGDIIIFEKQDGLFEQEVHSMQINRKGVKLAKSGSDIGLKVYLKPKVGAPVYKVI